MPDAASYCFERTEKGVRIEAVGYSFIFHAVLLVGEVQMNFRRCREKIKVDGGGIEGARRSHEGDILQRKRGIVGGTESVFARA